MNRRRSGGLVIAVMLVFAVATCSALSRTSRPAFVRTANDMEMPCTLRVAIYPMGSEEPLTSGPYTVTEVELAHYVADVLAHEFGDFTVGGVTYEFSAEALKAGAVAVLMYGWYYSRHPTKPDYDLDNSTKAQVYIRGKARQKHLDAVKAVWGTVMVRADTEEIVPPQHGQGRYNGGGKNSDWMSQRGSIYLADQGYTWTEILRYYYPKSKLLQHPNPCAGL